MAWTTPTTQNPGDAILASLWNTDVKDNTQQLRDDRSFVFIKSQSFSAASSVIVTSAFSSTYNHYRLVLKHSVGSTITAVTGQMRSGSTTETSANYAWGEFSAIGTTLAGSRVAAQTSWRLYATSSTAYDVSIIEIAGPFATARTSFFCANYITGSGGPEMRLLAGDLATSTSYDQIVFTPGSGTLTGAVSVYGAL